MKRAVSRLVYVYILTKGPLGKVTGYQSHDKCLEVATEMIKGFETKGVCGPLNVKLANLRCGKAHMMTANLDF